MNVTVHFDPDRLVVKHGPDEVLFTDVILLTEAVLMPSGFIKGTVTDDVKNLKIRPLGMYDYMKKRTFYHDHMWKGDVFDLPPQIALVKWGSGVHWAE